MSSNFSSTSGGTNSQTKTARKKRVKTVILWIFGLGLTAFLLGALLFTGLLAWYSRDLPDPNTLLERNVPQSTKIYDRTGQVLLYEIHGAEKRTLVQIQDIPDSIKWATVAVEDKTFYQHHGVNLLRTAKAVIVDIVERRKAQGGSTLTQQFVKNAILTNEKSLDRKLKEIILALQIERLYSKDQILQLYLNEIPYGSTLYGVESAAHSYFGKSAKDLALDESALLAALPQAPDYYSPYGTGSRGDNRDKLITRQHLILSLMAEQGYITKDQAEEAKKVDTLKKLLPKNIGEIKAPHFVIIIKQQLFDKYGQRTVEQGGYRVITSLSYDMQKIAEEEIDKGVSIYGPKYNFSNAAMVALDPKTGQILTMVGSRNYNDDSIKGKNNVTILKRQPGSSFKPIVYLAGFLKGYTPEMTFWDVNTKFKTDSGDYEPHNYSLDEHGPVSARMALQGSLNIPAVKMLYLVGVGRALDFAEQLGYSTFADRSRFGLALVLGGGEVKLLDHTSAYATFANQGLQMPPVYILKVEDSKGAILEEWQPGPGKQVVDKGAIAQLSNVLSDNSARAFVFRTKNYLTLPDRPVAAKTGTTNNYKDAWTMGYIPQLAAGVWVGNTSGTEMKTGADGSKIAAPIWQAFMARATKGLPVEYFPKPPVVTTTKPILLGKSSEVKVKVDRITGKLATEFTPPELIEERAYREAHSELWYIDKDDPRGPVPSDPKKDLQYNNWEAAVQSWVQRSNWNATSTLPTESDDVHTANSKPVVTVLSPMQNETWITRSPLISVGVSTPRTLSRLEAVLDGRLIGSSLDGSTTLKTSIPDIVEVGPHDLTIYAIDDVGNRGTATVTIQLQADPFAGKAAITFPVNGSHLSVASFPMLVTSYIPQPRTTVKMDVYLEEPTSGNTKLLGTAYAPQGEYAGVNWSEVPSPGTYSLYPVLTTQDGQTVIGNAITIYVESGQ